MNTKKLGLVFVVIALSLVAANLLTSVRALSPYDIDGDGSVGTGDLSLCAKYFGQTVAVNPEAAVGDVNHDGYVNLIDLVLIAIHWGQT